MGAADTKPHHATSTIAQPSPSIRFMASGFRCCGHHAIMMSFGCCPLFAVAVGSVSCFMLCVSVSAFCGSGILMACGHCTQACPLRAPTGVVCVSCFVCWLCSCCGCLLVVSCFCWFCLVFWLLSACCLSAGLLACACFRLFCRVFSFSAFPACCVEFGCPRVRKCEFWFFPCFWAGWLLFQKQKLCTWADTCDIG